MSRVQAKYRELVADVVGPVEGPDVPQGTVPPGHSDAAFAPGEPHVVPLWLLAAVLGALLFLTVVTVAITLVDLGNFNIVAALAIAVVKAALVILYFMHLRWDSPFNALILVASLLFVAIFMTFALLDSSEYQKNIDAAPITQAP
jgi:cytochrome c oxidase subunit 4